MSNGAGLYIHIPFCRSKCPYCDFYSLRTDGSSEKKYTPALICAAQKLAKAYPRRYDSVYFGGGTPSVLGASGLAEIVSRLRGIFDIDSGAEISLECNPYDAVRGFDFELMAAQGVNRISMGLQSAVECERRALGRLSGAEDVREAVRRALVSGIKNISLDLMLAVPGQSRSSILRSVDFCAESGASHVSAYLLKIEPGTRFFEKQDSLALPDEDETCEMYLTACKALEAAGFQQYEISNFSRPGFESRHNLKYWLGDEYLGLGPSAHSFMEGRRFCFPRDIESFINGCEPIPDGEGGTAEEFIMLRLRLTRGMRIDEYESHFGRLPQPFFAKAELLSHAGLLECRDGLLRLTRRGFLVSNAVIGELISAAQ